MSIQAGPKQVKRLHQVFANLSSLIQQHLKMEKSGSLMDQMNKIVNNSLGA